MIRARAVPVLAALIVTALTGCDNVEWGGARVAVVPPPPRAGEEVDEDSPIAERLPDGPILYHVRAVGRRALMVPVAEIERDTLLPIRATADWERYGQGYISEHLQPESEFVLFRAGGRVGTFVLENAGVPSEDVCPRVPRATGVLELGPGAVGATEFLALAKAQAPPDAARGPTAVTAPNNRMQLLSPILAERLLRARGAPLPGNWTRAMAQLRPFPVAGAEDPAFASTFLVDDSLAAGSDDEGYSLFFIAQPVERVGYDTAYAVYTDYPIEGKAAPRVVDFLDWDRDGAAELLLEVYGTRGSWFAALDRAAAGWRTVLRNPCPALRPPPPDTLARPGAAGAPPG